MGYIANLSSTSLIDAILTRRGKQILSSNTEVFQITQFCLGDDEINYRLLSSVVNIDQDDPDIIALPIPEPSTNQNSELLNKIWVNQTFLNQQFATSVTSSQYVKVTTNVGVQAILSSDDTVNPCVAWVSSFNALGIPYVADYYDIVFSTDIDCYTIQFTSPSLTDTKNLNYTKVSSNEYIFSAVNSDASGKYTQTNTGAPSLVFNITFAETPAFFQLIQQPQNKQSITIPNFATITQVDSTRTPIPNVAPATLSLQIINMIS